MKRWMHDGFKVTVTTSCAPSSTSPPYLCAVLDLYLCAFDLYIYAACMYGCAPTVLLVCEDEHQAHQNWHA
jgi:hypothetical protein